MMFPQLIEVPETAPTPEQIKKIKFEAERFQVAIESFLKDEAEYAWGLAQEEKGVLKSFPNGCCTHATPLLARYLYDCGFGKAKYFDANVPNRISGNTHIPTGHAWLQLGPLNVDITAHQFANEKRKIIVEVGGHFHLTLLNEGKPKEYIYDISCIPFQDSPSSERVKEHYRLYAILFSLIPPDNFRSGPQGDVTIKS